MTLRMVLRTGLGQIMSLCLATLREIFDESAYARFLARRQANSSPKAYTAFLREQSETRSGRHRCC
jgi:hypothetical protein